MKCLIEKLKQDLVSLKEKFIEVDRTLYRQEQYSKRNGLLVHEVDRKNSEDTDQAIIDIIKNNIVGKIIIYNIDKTHHLGKHELDNKVPQPIIVKFAKYKVRSSVFKTRKKTCEYYRKCYK